MEAWCNDENWMSRTYKAVDLEEKQETSPGLYQPNCQPRACRRSPKEADQSLYSLNKYTLYIEIVNIIYNDYTEIIRSSTPNTSTVESSRELNVALLF